MTKTKNGAALTKIIKSAIAMCRRLKLLKRSDKSRNKTINANITLAALNGVETTHASSQAMDGLRSAVAEGFGPKSSKRSIDMLYNLSDENKENDPKTQVLLRRVMELRRTMSKDSAIFEISKQIIKFYTENQHTFENIKQHDAIDNQEWIGITNWKKENHHEIEDSNKMIIGPIMLLMNEVKEYRYEMDCNFNMRKTNEPTINIWEMPCQHLKCAI